MLEMSVYEGIPHLLAPVVTDMKPCLQRAELVRGRNGKALSSLMSKMGVRNLAGYNTKIRRCDGQARGADPQSVLV